MGVNPSALVQCLVLCLGGLRLGRRVDFLGIAQGPFAGHHRTPRRFVNPENGSARPTCDGLGRLLFSTKQILLGLEIGQRGRFCSKQKPPPVGGGTKLAIRTAILAALMAAPR